MAQEGKSMTKKYLKKLHSVQRSRVGLGQALGPREFKDSREYDRKT